MKLGPLLSSLSLKEQLKFQCGTQELNLPKINLGMNNLESSDEALDQTELGKAIRLRDLGKYREAEILLRQLLVLSQNDPEIISILSQVLLMDRRLSEAESTLSEAQAINPKLTSVIRNQARIFLEKNRPVDALEQAKIAIGVCPEEPENRLVLAGCMQANNNDEGALQIIELLLEADPEYAEALGNRALIRFRNNDLGGAINDLTLATSIKPELSRLWALLGYFHRRNGELKYAINAMTCAHNNNPHNIDSIINLAEVLTIDKKITDAIYILEGAIDKVGPNIRVLSSLGTTLLQDKQRQKSKTIFKKILTIDPKHTTALTNLGNIYKEEENYTSAFNLFSRALQWQPKLAEAHSNLGCTLLSLGNIKEAIKSIQTAIDIDPKVADYYNNLGIAFAAQGNFLQAEKRYLQSISINPAVAEVHNNLALTYKGMGNLGSAITHLEKSLEINPSNSLVISNLGNTLRSIGKYKEAEINYRNALLLEPDSAEHHFNLAENHMLAGEITEAKTSYSRSMAIRPTFTEANNGLLKCLYLLEEKEPLLSELDKLLNMDKANAVTASVTHRAKMRYGVSKENLFCEDPMRYVVHKNLNHAYNFKKIFIQNTIAVLSRNIIQNRRQPLLENGVQTYGNIFDIEREFTSPIQQAIHSEILAYRELYKNSKEGIIRKWPKNYLLKGWYITMTSGGSLDPHIHENGWLSGSIYINVPKNTGNNNGNLIVSLGQEADLAPGTKLDCQTVNIETGSMVLFPASLTHYTSPFKSQEKRIVLAFDVVPQ